ncbi:MAG: PQQ-dependent sugar dehydrogenase [Sphingomicrobium sp.]
MIFSPRTLQAFALLVLAACSGQSPAPAQEAGAPFVKTAVATFDSPWALAFLPGGRSALVTEKPGHVWLIDTATGRKQEVGGVPAVQKNEGQGGLLDVALSPGFETDRLVYLTYSEPAAGSGSGLALARARLDGTNLADLKVLWRDSGGGRGGQFGGVIAFAPDGGSLFLSTGERQRFTPAQDPNEPLGKVLHLTLDGAPAAGNPWAGKTGTAAVSVTAPPEDTREAATARGHEVRWPALNRTPAETWSLGHRNPYGLAFDGQGRLWETEMGPMGGDELNLIERGRNYGWPLVSEGSNYDGVAIPAPSTRPDLEAAKLFWNPVISPTTVMFYKGGLFPQWKGDAFIGSLSAQALVRVTFAGGAPQKADQWDMGARIRWVGQGPDGAMYLLEDGSGGRLLRLAPGKS